MAGGWATQRRTDDLDDIDAWMAQRNANVALRQEAETVGRDLWDQATRDGQDLSAPQPSDLVTIGAGALNRNEQPVGPANPSVLGDGEYGLSLQQPNGDLTVGLNALDGRSSTLQVGHSYAVPTRIDDATPDEIATGNHLLRADNARFAAAPKFLHQIPHTQGSSREPAIPASS